MTDIRHRLSAAILSVVLVAAMSGCGEKKADKSYDVFDSAYEPVSSEVLPNADSNSNKKQDTPHVSEDRLDTVSKESFTEIVTAYGEIQDVSKDFGFDALAVHSDNSLNYIYMMLQNDAAAKSMIFGNADSINPNVSIVKTGDNYDYYEEKYESDENSRNSFFGYYLRVDNMLLLVTGPINDSNAVRSGAKSFFRELGYNG